MVGDATGRCQARRGDHDRAIADFTAAIRLDPGFVQAYVNRSIAYKGKGDEARAKADMEKAAELHEAQTAPKPAPKKEPAKKPDARSRKSGRYLLA